MVPLTVVVGGICAFAALGVGSTGGGFIFRVRGHPTIIFFFDGGRNGKE